MLQTYVAPPKKKEKTKNLETTGKNFISTVASTRNRCFKLKQRADRLGSRQSRQKAGIILAMVNGLVFTGKF